MDFRFIKAIRGYLDEQGMTGDCDRVSFAGAVKNIADPADSSQAAFALRQIELSHDLHHISHVVLMNHLDCGAYGGAAAFVSPEEEIAKHTEDLKRARVLIFEKYPDLKITLVIAGLQENGEVAFTEIVTEQVTA